MDTPWKTGLHRHRHLHPVCLLLCLQLFDYDRFEKYCRYGDLVGLERLVATFGAANVVGAKDSKGRTGLHWAALHGHVKIVALLLDNNADANAKDDIGNTPMDHFLKKPIEGKDDEVDLLKLLEDAKKRQVSHHHHLHQAVSGVVARRA
jgi:hypothetical protein